MSAIGRSIPINSIGRLVPMLLAFLASALPASAQGVLETFDNVAFTYQPSPSTFDLGIDGVGNPCPGPASTLAFCSTDSAATPGTDFLVVVGSLGPPLAVPIKIGDTELGLNPLDPLFPVILEMYGASPFGSSGVATTLSFPIAADPTLIGLPVFFQGLRTDFVAPDFIGNTNIHTVTLIAGC